MTPGLAEAQRMTSDICRPATTHDYLILKRLRPNILSTTRKEISLQIRAVDNPVWLLDRPHRSAQMEEIVQRIVDRSFDP